MIPPLINASAYLRLRVGVDESLRLQLDLVLYLLRRGTVTVGGTRRPPCRANERRLRPCVDYGLGLDLGEGGDLGGVHGYEPPSAVLRRSDDRLSLGGGLHHRLGLGLQKIMSKQCTSSGEQ